MHFGGKYESLETQMFIECLRRNLRLENNRILVTFTGSLIMIKLQLTCKQLISAQSLALGPLKQSLAVKNKTPNSAQ